VLAASVGCNRVVRRRRVSGVAANSDVFGNCTVVFVEACNAVIVE